MFLSLQMVTYQKNTVEDKVSAEIKKEFDSEPVYDKNYLKTKIKCRGNDVTDFYDKKIPELDSNHTCSAVTTLDFAITKDENYYPPLPPSVFKRVQPYGKKVVKQFHDNLCDFSYSSDESDEEQIFL